MSIKSAIAKLVGGLSEECLAARAEIKRLQAEARRYYHADGSFVELDSAEEVVKLRIDAAKKMEWMQSVMVEPKLLDIELEPGGALRMDLEPGIGAKVMAASFADMIGKAPNWASFVIGPFPTSDQGRLVVTVRRFDGHSPEEQVAKAKEIIGRLISTFGLNAPAIFSDERLAVVNEAQEFIKPIPVDDSGRPV